MSADNWCVCPRCKSNSIRERREREKSAEDSYGKVSADEYLRLREEAKTSLPFGETLREDWGIGIDEHGVFSVSYRASCDMCGFWFEYKDEKNTMKAVAKAAGRE